MVEGSNNNSTAFNTPYLYTIQCEDHQWPIVYKDSYNISFVGIEKLQSMFDTSKWKNVHKKLVGKLHTLFVAMYLHTYVAIVCTYIVTYLYM